VSIPMPAKFESCPRCIQSFASDRLKNHRNFRLFSPIIVLKIKFHYFRNNGNYLMLVRPFRSPFAPLSRPPNPKKGPDVFGAKIMFE